MCTCLCECCAYVFGLGALGDQKRPSDPLALELIGFASRLTWVLGSELYVVLMME